MRSLTEFSAQLEAELTEKLLPFTMDHVLDLECGGFYGHVANDLSINKKAPKGLVQHSRLLWVYAHAFRIVGDPDYLRTASRAYWYLVDNFWDTVYEGLVWLVDAQGQPVDKHKIVYGQAFALYGLSEYFQATGEQQSLDMAVALFRALENNALDQRYGGYFEAFSREWRFTDEVNVDETAVPTVKSMNTNLHVLEAYTNLLRAWPVPQVKASLRAQIGVMLERIIDRERWQMKRHFGAEWRSLTDTISYGHDIEASWLLVEAAEVLGDEKLLAEVSQVAVHMAQAAYDKGLNDDGSLRDTSENNDKVWWVQSEAVIGFFNAFQLTGKEYFLEASLGCWQTIQDSLIDRQYGEWFFGLGDDGRPLERAKAGLWKTPYHNGRACMEIMRRVGQPDEGNSYPEQNP